MSKMVKFEFEAKAGKSEELSAHFIKILPGTRNFVGNIDAEAARLSANSNKYIIITHWEHSDDLDKYLSWRQESGDFAKLLTFLIQAPDIQTYEVLTDH